MPYENARVVAHFGYRENETPRVLFINEEKITVVEILDMWIEECLPDKTRKRFFTVKGRTSPCMFWTAAYTTKLH